MDKVEEILKKYPYISEDIQKLQAELNRYIALQEEARNPLKGQALTGMPHGYGTGNQTLDAVEKLIDRYQAEIDKCAAEINKLLDLKKWLDKAFDELSENERRVIYLKYDKGLSINKIPYTLHWKCGRDKIYQTLDDAKAKIRRIIT